MDIVFHTNIPSPHQLPWCRELARLAGDGQFLYLAEEKLHPERARMGWSTRDEPWLHVFDGEHDPLRKRLESCDVLITSLREYDLMEQRTRAGRRTLHLFERWLKPPQGALRLLHPAYFLSCRRAMGIFASPLVTLLPIGIFAAQDMARIADTIAGHPFLSHEIIASASETTLRVPGGAGPMASLVQNGSKSIHFGNPMRLWGYFTEENADKPMSLRGNPGNSGESLRIFWCGRMLGWKRAKTVVEAVLELLSEGHSVSLRMTGEGPEFERLRELAGGWLGGAWERGICLEDSVSMEEIRGRMRESDVYVLSSDGAEGWGASLNEAMGEGCVVVGTREAGSSATRREEGRNGCLCSAGDAKGLAAILRGLLERRRSQGEAGLCSYREAAQETIRGAWSPRSAARALWEVVSR